MRENADFFLDIWRNEFNIIDFDAPLSEENRHAFLEVKVTLSEMLAYCEGRHLRPVLTQLPMSRALTDAFGATFRKHYIDDFIDVANTVHAPVLDYSGDCRFSSDEPFFNALFLNQTGRRRMTKIVLSDLKGMSYVE